MRQAAEQMARERAGNLGEHIALAKELLVRQWRIEHEEQQQRRKER